MENEIYPTLPESQMNFDRNQEKRPALSKTYDCNRYWFVISKKRYSLICQHKETTKVVKEKHKSLKTTKQYDKPVIGDIIYAEKLWTFTNPHKHICAVASKLVQMNSITLAEVKAILEQPSAEGFCHLYELYYDRTSPHHTPAYVISIVEIKDKLISWMADRNVDTEDETPVYSFIIYRNENSRYKLAINKIPNECEIIDIDELACDNSQAQKNDEQLEFGVDPDLRMINITQYPHILLRNSTGFKMSTTYKRLSELKIEFDFLFDATKNAIDSTSKALKNQKKLIDGIDFESITLYLKDVPTVFFSFPTPIK